MLSVLIPTHDSAADLAVLLSALVPAAVDGLVREVICADAGSTDGTLEICEDAGARVVAGGLVAAARAAKSDWVLVLPVGLVLKADWAERTGVHLARGRRRAVIRGAPGPGPLAWLSPAAGLLAERDGVASQGETREVARLVRAMGRGAVRL